MGDPTERWLPVPGYEGLYEVSDLGRVRSLDREITDFLPEGRYRTRPGRRVRRLKGRMLKPYIGKGSSWNYPVVGLLRDGVEKSRLVHHLVLEAFIGPRPEGQEARHGPAGKTDASLANLCWGTRAENIADRLRDGQDNNGERGGRAKLTWEAIEDIRRRVAAGETQRSVARRYGVTFQNISIIVSGKTWRPLNRTS